MPNKKGFSLIELIIVMMILGILAAIAVPSYFSNIQQGAATSAQNNLTSIYNAEKNYYFTNSSYCTAACGSTSTINTTLSLNITDSNFSYACSGPTTAFTCTATNNLDGAFTLEVTNNPVVLYGGSTCTSTTGVNPGCNPSCAYAAHPTYCPNN